MKIQNSDYAIQKLSELEQKHIQQHNAATVIGATESIIAGLSGASTILSVATNNSSTSDTCIMAAIFIIAAATAGYAFNKSKKAAQSAKALRNEIAYIKSQNQK